MTTKVTVTANGACYPARVIKWQKTDESDEAIEDVMVASGQSYETWVGTNQTVAVTEEYHPGGYPAESKE